MASRRESFQKSTVQNDDEAVLGKPAHRHPQRVATRSQPGAPGAVHVDTLVAVEPSARVVAETVIESPQSSRNAIPQYLKATMTTV